MKKDLCVTLVIVLVTFAVANSATRTAVASGSWLSAAVWDCNCVPAAADDIVIPIGIKVNIVNTLISFVDLNAISIDVYGELDLINASLNLNSWDILRVYSGGRISESGLGGILTSGTSSFTAFPVNGPATFSNGSLPILLNFFTANADRSSVVIKWESSMEDNLSYYVLERSVDGITFSSLATVTPTGGIDVISAYEYLDSDPFVGRSYYRLRSVDLDGFEEVFEVKSVDATDIARKVTLFPVPVTGKTLNVKLNFVSALPTLVRVITSLGKPLIEKTFSGNEAVVDLTDLSPGVYYIESITSERKFLQRILVH